MFLRCLEQPLTLTPFVKLPPALAGLRLVLFLYDPLIVVTPNKDSCRQQFFIAAGSDHVDLQVCGGCPQVVHHKDDTLDHLHAARIALHSLEHP